MKEYIRIPADEIREFITDLVETIDHDIAKDLHPETAEDPDYAEPFMMSLIYIVQSYDEYDDE